ncbi:MAG: FHA domain-containing protein [Nitrospirae bacterium]|nr:FHA domain-containing protein [Nitrospirota bacterium]
MADADTRRFYLVIVDNEPYAAGEEQHGIFAPLTLHGFFATLHHLPSAALTLAAADPIFLKSLLTLIQRVPSTEGTTELMEIGGVVDHLKKTDHDQLLVVSRQREVSLFYFKGRELLSGYFADPELEVGEDSIEERLLAYVYRHAGQGAMSLYVFSSMETAPAEDGVFERGRWPDELVEYFTRPVPHLLIVGSNGAARRYELTAPTVTLGRSEENDLVIEDPAISRRHLIFRQDAKGFSVEDCGSRNGTLCNGAPLTQTQLNHGAELQMGTCLIRFFGGGVPTESVPVGGHGDETICRVPSEAPLIPNQPPTPSPAPQTWVVDIVRSDGVRDRLPLAERITTVGRAKADLVLVDTRVSRRHGEFEVGPDGLTYRDTGSTNGSLLNGRSIASERLKPGDVLKLGETSITILLDAA